MNTGVRLLSGCVSDINKMGEPYVTSVVGGLKNLLRIVVDYTP